MKAVDANKISGGFGLLFALFTIKESFGIGVGALRTPGPGLFPLFGGILLALFSMILLVRAFIEHGRAAETAVQGGSENTHLAIYAFLGVLVYVLVLEWLGFLLATFSLVVFFSRTFDHRKWWVTLMTAAIVAAACYILFAYFLKSDLPLGILEDLF